MSAPWTTTALVAAGSAAGACARFAIGAPGVSASAIAGLPWGTLAVNVAGSLLIGLYVALRGPGSRREASAAEQALVMAGFCGGFTTFSLFSAEVAGSLQRQQWGLAAGLLSISVAAWLAGAWAGYAAGRRLDGRPA